VRNQVHVAHAVLGRRAEAVRELEREALPTLDENESLARRSYEVGQIGLGDLLLLRREVLEARSEYIERLFESAVSQFELEAAAGVLP
jgi:cobalt-zinc-cadmium efflux system outer membrane protein